MESLINWISQPWPWYVSGPLIGLTVPVMLIIGGKPIGISSSLKHICASCIPADISYFKYDWKKYLWNIVFVFGVFLGGAIGMWVFQDPNQIVIEEITKVELRELGITDFRGYLPAEIFSLESFTTYKGYLFLVLGGFMVGFGTRYAEGCTSGHTIMGLSNLSWVSLIATCSFFAGGLIMTHFILPYLL